MPTPIIESSEPMISLPASEIVDAFYRIKYRDLPDGSGRIVWAWLKLLPFFHDYRYGLAIDGSGSMEPLFGKQRVSAFLPHVSNLVAPAAQAMSSFLAKKAADGNCTVIYWATGQSGKDIQVIGDLTVTEAEKYKFSPPNQYGTGTRLLPALRYFTDGVTRKDLCDAEWGMYVFITDGQLEDLEEVKEYCTKMARDIEAGRRHDLKLVIIGLGDQVDEDQLDQLHHLNTGTEVDLWDAQLAADMKSLDDLFNQVYYGEDSILVDSGLIRDDLDMVVVNYQETGMPLKVIVRLPPGTTQGFTLEYKGKKIRQPLP